MAACGDVEEATADDPFEMSGQNPPWSGGVGMLVQCSCIKLRIKMCTCA